MIPGIQLKPEILLDGLGSKFLITDCGYKAFPTEALTHQPMSAVLNILQKNDLVAEDLASIHIQTTARGADILSDPSKFDPQTKETADHSLPYCLAAAAADGGVLHPAIMPEEGELVVRKNTYDAFNDTELGTSLEEMGVTDLVVCGVMTNLCCETTAREAFCRNLRVKFIADGTSTAADSMQIASLINLSYGFAEVVLAEDLLSD